MFFLSYSVRRIIRHLQYCTVSVGAFLGESWSDCVSHSTFFLLRLHEGDETRQEVASLACLRALFAARRINNLSHNLQTLCCSAQASRVTLHHCNGKFQRFG